MHVSLRSLQGREIDASIFTLAHLFKGDMAHRRVHQTPSLLAPTKDETNMIQRLGVVRDFAMKLGVLVFVSGIVLLAQASAQTQSNAPADRTTTQNVSRALVQAGIDPRTTSVQVVTATGHIVYLSGLISSGQLIKTAGAAAAKAAPGYRIVNNIRSSFFDDPSHVSGGVSK